MNRVWLASVLVLGSIPSLPTTAYADIPDVDTYAESQCGNGAYAAKNYPSYEVCYSAAVSYYYYQTGGGGGGGDGGGGGWGGDGGGGSGGTGGGGGTFIGDVPGYTGEGCVSRLCDAGEPDP